MKNIVTIAAIMFLATQVHGQRVAYVRDSSDKRFELYLDSLKKWNHYVYSKRHHSQILANSKNDKELMRMGAKMGYDTPIKTISKDNKGDYHPDNKPVIAELLISKTFNDGSVTKVWITKCFKPKIKVVVHKVSSETKITNLQIEWFTENRFDSTKQYSIHQ